MDPVLSNSWIAGLLKTGEWGRCFEISRHQNGCLNLQDYLRHEFYRCFEISTSYSDMCNFSCPIVSAPLSNALEISIPSSRN